MALPDEGSLRASGGVTTTAATTAAAAAAAATASALGAALGPVQLPPPKCKTVRHFPATLRVISLLPAALLLLARPHHSSSTVQLLWGHRYFAQLL